EAERHRIGFDVGDEPVLVRLQDLGCDRRHTDSGGCGAAAGASNWMAYSQALQPLTMWVRRSTAAPSTSCRKFSSAAHTSGNRSATERIAQLCSASSKVPSASRQSAM